MSIVNPDPTHIKVSNNEKKVTITPHGFSNTFPAQDTINLQWVFNNYRKADINLVQGTYHISETIEAPGYQGRIKGQGKNKTFLTGRGPLIGNDYVFPMLNADLTTRLYPSGVPQLIWFHALDDDVENWENAGVDIELKDLTISLSGVGPAIELNQQPFRSIWMYIIVTGYNAALNSMAPINEKVSNIKADFNNVNFISNKTPYVLNNIGYTNANSAAAIIFYGGENWVPDPSGNGLRGLTEDAHSPVNTQISIKNCYFENFHQFGIATECSFYTNPNTGYIFPTTNLFPESTISIKNNIFKNVGNGAGIAGSLGFNILILGISETKYDITDNLFDEIAANGIGLINGVAEIVPKLTSKFTIKDNTFNQINVPIAGNSVWLFDLTAFYGQYYDVLIKDNKFNGETGYANSFIGLSSGTKTVIDDNDFNGSAKAAIEMGNTFIAPDIVLPATETVVRNNNFCDLVASVANVILGVASALNTVYVSDVSDVLDSGYMNVINVNDCKCNDCGRYNGGHNECNLGDHEFPVGLVFPRFG